MPNIYRQVWHLEQRHCSGVLRNCSALPLCLDYAEFTDVAKIVVCGTNSGSIHTWNADTNELIATATKHYSQISALCSLPKSKNFVSAGRDKTLIFWSWNLQPLKVIPVFEELETIDLCSLEFARKLTKNSDLEGQEFALVSGEKGKLRLWNAGKNMVEILPRDSKDFEVNTKGVVIPQQKVNQVMVCPDDNGLIICQDDLLSVCNFSQKKNNVEQYTLCSNQHEILDMTMIDGHYLAVASMSNVIKIYNLKEDFKLLLAHDGHTESVLAVNTVDHQSFVSCGKDHSVCLWSVADDQVKLVAKGSGHSSFVGAVASSAKSIFSASKDGILKVWKRPTNVANNEVVELQTSRTLLAHDQEVNSVNVSEDNEFVATASQDKSCKIWRISDMALVHVLNGHRRGIWKVKFTQDSIWTASADCNIKRWSIKTFQCLSTFEGHLASVLSVISVDEKRLASVASDGLLKVWDVKTGMALGTFDAHEDKIWALTFSQHTGNVITAGRDGNIYFWEDKTEEKKEQERQKQNEMIKTEQTLANYVQSGQLDKALR